MTPPAPKRPTRLDQSEADFQEAVLEFARLSGWRLAYHTLTSIGSAAGFPDLVMIRDRRLIFAELKTEKGRLTPAQVEWLDALWSLGSPVEAYLWRPADWPAIEATLGRHRHPVTGRVPSPREKGEA